MLQLVLADHKTIHRLCEGLGEEELRACSLSGVDVRSGEGKDLSSDIWSGNHLFKQRQHQKGQISSNYSIVSQIPKL